MSSTIRLQATGEAVTFLNDDQAPPGERLLMEVRLPPGRSGPPPHIHPLQSESFEVIDGTLSVRIAGDRLEVDAGGRITVDANRLHSWRNAGKGTVRFRVEVTPALNREWMLREIFASCNRRGSAKPSLWDGAYVIAQLQGEYSLGNVPKAVQRFVFPVIAVVGRLLRLTKASPGAVKEGRVARVAPRTTAPPLGM
jgi:quercetin dioxygenase-like cupin family protein